MFHWVWDSQPDGSFTKCRVLPPKDFSSNFGKGKRQSELKSIQTDPLKLLLAYAFNTFIGGDRVILPTILEWKNNPSMSPADLKESWLTECFKWFPKRDANKGKYGAAGIVHNGINPVFVMFSYEEETGVIQPSLTAFVSEKKQSLINFHGIHLASCSWTCCAWENLLENLLVAWRLMR